MAWDNVDSVPRSFGVAQFELEELRELSSTDVMETVDGLAVRQRFWIDQSKALKAAGLAA